MSALLEVSPTLRLEDCRVGAFRIPTDRPESDGTFEWRDTTLVVVELTAGGESGLGYTYGPAMLAALIREACAAVMSHCDICDIEANADALFSHLRNSGRSGLSAMAVSALDVAQWDLKAKLLRVPLLRLLGACREALPLYGSGGFTSYTDAELRRQFTDFAELGITRFKMKIGREPQLDPGRAAAARDCIGDRAELMIDANNAFTRTQARAVAERFVREFGVVWFEQPLPCEDLEGLKYLREHAPAGLEIADGEYGYDLEYFRRAFAAQAIDVAMADATRCGGITGFLKIATLCEAWKIPLSSHCAPALHLHVGCAARALRHAEYFHDHARIESMLFAGVPDVRGGMLRPDMSVPGHGLEFKWHDAERFAV
ncbi:MAG TPA: enolase C-terminal domain-like protein [Opitutaceae bacterium]|nr:enolase C-terminal domain-like protein [Opitutaceae bacterium]